ncbi:hypothetical protein, partial [Sporisorium scitamineum]
MTDAQQAIQQTLPSPPSTSHPNPTSSPPNPSSTQHADPSSIIGTVTFTHDPAALDTHLRQTISMWKGQRALVGV